MIGVFHDAAKAAVPFQQYLEALEAELPAVKTKHAGPSARALWEWIVATVMQVRPGMSANQVSQLWISVQAWAMTVLHLPR